MGLKFFETVPTVFRSGSKDETNLIFQWRSTVRTLMSRTNITILLVLSFWAILAVERADAAFGDCVSWIWGGKNESTTYSPPYSPTVASMNSDSGQNGGLVAAPTVLGQSASSAAPVYVSPPPSYTVVCPNEYPTYSAMKPVSQVSTPQPATELRPIVKKEWTYSPIKSVNYKPVQQIDPQTGQVSTYYRPEESKTLLPWLHQKETIEYKPVLVPPKAMPSAASTSQIVQANYADPSTARATQVSYSSMPVYDPCNPCGNLVFQGNVLHEGEWIPTESIGETTFNQSPNASSTASTFVAQSTGSNRTLPVYGIPPVREGYEPGSTRAYSETTVPASAADQIPVIDSSRAGTARKPDVSEELSSPKLSLSDLRPAHPFTLSAGKPDTEETTDSPEPKSTVKSSDMIKTPTPALPTLKSTEKPAAKPTANTEKLVSPTKVHLKYRPLEAIQ